MKEKRAQIKESHWDSRALERYRFKANFFYTITPLPAYIWRRKAILYLIQETINRGILEWKNVADFGCGDGWYLCELQKRFPSLAYTGIDSSKKMLQIASLNTFNCDFAQSMQDVEELKYFDLVYTVSTLAHLNDSVLRQVFRDFRDRLNESGTLILCEQSAPVRQSGEKWVRRAEGEYEEIARREGFKKVESYLIDYPFHRFFERRLAHIFYDRTRSDNSRKRANSNILFLILSYLFLNLRRGIYKKRGGWGYVFMRFELAKPEF